MSEASAAAAGSAANGAALAELLTQQLKGLLEAGNYDGVKLLLQPVQEVDIAEAIGGLPRTLQALAFRLLPKNEAIEVYEYLEPSVQQTLLERLRSNEVLELVEEIQQFCSTTYGVNFPIYAKVAISAAPFDTLVQSEPAGPVAWNFEKFLVGKDGTVVARFKSGTEPESAELKGAIEAALAA